MHTKLVKIGNSQGIRIPKAVVEQANLGEDLDLEVRGDAVIIRRLNRLRDTWAEAAAACHDRQEDDLADWDATTGDDWS